MQSRTVTIQNAEGMHARPASVFVRTASRFQSEVTLTAGETTVNGKSIMGLLMLALCAGAEVTVAATGSDEVEAADALADLDASAYRPFNFVVADNRDAFWIALRPEASAVAGRPSIAAAGPPSSSPRGCSPAPSRLSARRSRRRTTICRTRRPPKTTPTGSPTSTGSRSTTG